MKKILIVDDEEILRMLISDTLEDLDVHIEFAEDGRIATGKIESNRLRSVASGLHDAGADGNGSIGTIAAGKERQHVHSDADG